MFKSVLTPSTSKKNDQLRLSKFSVLKQSIAQPVSPRNLQLPKSNTARAQTPRFDPEVLIQELEAEKAKIQGLEKQKHDLIIELIDWKQRFLELDPQLKIMKDEMTFC